MNLYQHQQTTINFITATAGRCFIASDPGTGKTATVLRWFVDSPAKRMLVLCPKSIMKAAWLADVRKFAPELSAAVATGTAADKHKLLADTRYQVIITNHDSINLIASDPALVAGFDTAVVDESTAFKTGTASRTKALLKASLKWKYRIGMSGTPTPQSILDLWAQLKFVRPDKVPLFSAFRNQVCVPMSRILGNGIRVTEWQERPSIRAALIAYYSDTIIRFAREDCIDLPTRTFRTLSVELTPRLRKLYNAFRNDALMELGEATISAVHAGSVAQKLLQLTSGFIYDNERDHHCLSEERYELISELVEERAHSLVAFNFKAQRDHLVDLFNRKEITHAIIDGDTPDHLRHKIVEDFNNGMYQTLLCHPKSAGHGLTMNIADTIIWAGATANTEHFEQFNARNFRIGQTKHTEVIMIEADHTYEQKLYARLMSKRDKQLDLLAMLKEDI